MPNLRAISDPEELDNRYVNKCIVYVEGDDDQKVWQYVIGSDFAGRIEFKVPISAGSGYGPVIGRVRQERQSNPKIFGLLDGEVAAVYGKVAELITCDDVIFTLSEAFLDGLLFLGEHELENVLLRHSNLPDYISQNTSTRNLGSRDRASVEREILSLARRFFVAALFKYASAHLRFAGADCAILNVDKFKSNDGTLSVIRDLKTKLRQDGMVEVAIFMREVFALARLMRDHAQDKRMSAQTKGEHMIRLADGKGLLSRVLGHWNMTRTCEGHLIHYASVSQFAQDFRDRLIALTAA